MTVSMDDQIEPISNDVFPLGAIVQCKTCRGGQIIEGEVLAFDHTHRVLALKTNAGAVGTKCPVAFLNLSFVETVEVIKEASPANSSVQLPQVNVTKIQQRLQEAIENKTKSATPAEVTVEGQRLFMAIRRTLNEVQWDEDRIVVFHQVSVSPPYAITNVQALPSHCGNQAATISLIEHVKKIVEKHSRDQQSISSDKLDETDIQSPSSNASYSSASSAAAEKASNISNGPTPPPESDMTVSVEQNE